mmetsp:Transcript_76557/g.236433  ORF Transcript_76557/g.236433 Transcript_76557/m.236433 type:complete len:381 (+) Transcript_76557:36-1178(+)
MKPWVKVTRLQGRARWIAAGWGSHEGFFVPARQFFPAPWRRQHYDRPGRTPAWYCSACGLGHDTVHVAKCRACKQPRVTPMQPTQETDAKRHRGPKDHQAEQAKGAEHPSADAQDHLELPCQLKSSPTSSRRARRLRPRWPASRAGWRAAWPAQTPPPSLQTRWRWSATASPLEPGCYPGGNQHLEQLRIALAAIDGAEGLKVEAKHGPLPKGPQQRMDIAHRRVFTLKKDITARQAKAGEATNALKSAQEELERAKLALQGFEAVLVEAHQMLGEAGELGGAQSRTTAVQATAAFARDDDELMQVQRGMANGFEAAKRRLEQAFRVCVEGLTEGEAVMPKELFLWPEAGRAVASAFGDQSAAEPRRKKAHAAGEGAEEL